MIPCCPYEIEAWANNHSRFHRELGIVGSGQVYQLHEVMLRKLDHSIAGRITDEKGAPLADLVLTAADREGYRVWMRCDADGHFDVFGIPAGFVQIGVREKRTGSSTVQKSNPSEEMLISSLTAPPSHDCGLSDFCVCVVESLYDPFEQFN